MRIAIITGASSGIGREFAISIDKKYSPDCIWLISRDEERLRQTASAIKTKTEIIPIDLSKENATGYIRQKLKKEKPQILYLVNAAGFGKFGCVSSVSDGDTENMINVNIRSLTMITKICIPFMPHGSHIINMSSASSFVPLPYMNVYSATKSYVLRFSQALSYELENSGISVTAVCPYWVSTGFIPTAQDSPDGDDVNNFAFITYPFRVVGKALCDSEKKKRLSMPGMSPKIIKFLAKILPAESQQVIWKNIRKFSPKGNLRPPAQLQPRVSSDRWNL